MARPRTRQQLIDYCKRALGHPVIQINVDDDQLEDRVDESLQFFSHYHFDGIEKVFLRYTVTQTDIDNGYISLTSSGSFGNAIADVGTPTGLTGESRQTVTESGETGTVNIDDLIASVLGVFHFSQSTINMFDVRYQYALNDLYTFGTIELQQYAITQQYLALLRQILSPDKAIRFTRHTNKLHIDMNWSRDVQPGDYIIIECYRILNPRVYPDVYDDYFLKKYVTAMFKRQWGLNLKKYQGIALPGNVTLNADQIYMDAIAEIESLEKEIRDSWETPPQFEVG